MYTGICNIGCIPGRLEKTSTRSLLDVHKYEEREREREREERASDCVKGELRKHKQSGGGWAICNIEGIDITSTQHAISNLDAERSRTQPVSERREYDGGRKAGEKEGVRRCHEWGVLYFHPASVKRIKTEVNQSRGQGDHEDLYPSVSISTGDFDRGQASAPNSFAWSSSRPSASSHPSIGRGSAKLRGVVTVEAMESIPICVEGDVASNGEGG